MRSNLEKLVNENPEYKGKGKLAKQIRVRIVSSIRCAIRMRSLESDMRKAIKNLEHDITNCINHIYGDHSRCSDFCKANLKDKSSAQAHEAIDNDDTENIFDEQSCFWNEGTSNDALEESRLSSQLSITDLMSCMRQDLSLILSRVAKKSASLLGNFTSNLAEMWMHVRTKYDGGKIYNHCNRGSWHNRC